MCTPRKFSSCPRKGEESNELAKMKQVKLSGTNFYGSYKTTAPWSQMEMHQFNLTELGTASAFLLLLPVPAHKMLHLTSIWLHLSKITQFFSILAFYCKYLIHHISWVRLYSPYLFLGFQFSFYISALSPQSLTVRTGSNFALPGKASHWYQQVPDQSLAVKIIKQEILYICNM